MRIWSLVPLALAVLEILHPTWTDGSVSDGVRTAGSLWVPLHIALLLGYVALATLLWKIARSRVTRAVLLIFGVGNSLYLGVDGIAVGLLTREADALWSAPWVTVLADATGAAWAASLLLLTDRWRTSSTVRVACGVVWLAFLATTVAEPAVLVTRIAALGTGFWAVYEKGSNSIPVALLIFASVLRQHVGAEAALGLVFVAIATARSSPAAASLPSTD